MRTKAICSFFVVFAIAAGLSTAVPAAFADHPEVRINAVVGSEVDFGCKSETENRCYDPGTLTVDVGAEIIMHNPDTSPSGTHTFTSGVSPFFDGEGADGVFDSGNLGALGSGDTFTWTADAPGTYEYFCTLHAWMTGTIIVQEAAGGDDGGHGGAGHHDDDPPSSGSSDATDDPDRQMTDDRNGESTTDGLTGSGTHGDGGHGDEAAEELWEEGDVMMAVIEAEPVDVGERATIEVDLSVVASDGDEKNVMHYNYQIIAMQGETEVLNKEGHAHDGKGVHVTDALPMAVSDDTPLEVEVIFDGFGHDVEYENRLGPKGDSVIKQSVVPEFGAIAMMVLAVSVISIIAITSKSRMSLRV